MDYYIYIINLDDVYIKFGISCNIKRRLEDHYRKFVKKLKLKEKLDILQIINFNNKILYKEVEKHKKKYITLIMNPLMQFTIT